MPAASMKTREEVLREYRCDQILLAARKVIGERGYTETSVDMIADEAGIAKSTLYVYFKSKEEIVERALQRLQDTLQIRDPHPQKAYQSMQISSSGRLSLLWASHPPLPKRIERLQLG